MSDAGGGVASVVLRVDGAERARVDAGGDCAKPYVVVAPCPATLPASLELDTRTLSDGPHVAQVAATDAAGQTTTSEPLPFIVANTATGGGRRDGGTGGAGGGSTDPGRVVARRARAGHRSRLDRDAVHAARARAAGSRASCAAPTARRPPGCSSSSARGASAPTRRGPRTERTLRTDGAGRFAIPLGVDAAPAERRARRPGLPPGGVRRDATCAATSRSR